MFGFFYMPHTHKNDIGVNLEIYKKKHLFLISPVFRSRAIFYLSYPIYSTTLVIKYE